KSRLILPSDGPPPPTHNGLPATTNWNVLPCKNALKTSLSRSGPRSADLDIVPSRFSTGSKKRPGPHGTACRASSVGSWPHCPVPCPQTRDPGPKEATLPSPSPSTTGRKQCRIRLDSGHQPRYH